MATSALLAEAERLGVDTKIPITSTVRQPDCNASVAELIGIEGNFAVYRGVCQNGHQYDMRVELNNIKQEQKQKLHVTHNKLELGTEEEFIAGGLEEY